MPNELDPVLLRAMQGIMNRTPPTRGAGLVDNPSIMRTLGMNQLRMMAGRNPSQSYRPQSNPLPPGVKPMAEPAPLPEPVPLTGKAKKQARIQEFINQAKLPKQGTDLERNPGIEPFLKVLKEENIPFSMRISNQGNTAYIFYGPEGNKKTFTMRVPHPSLPHTGNPKNMDDVRKLIDTAGIESVKSISKYVETGPLKNASGGSFSDPNNVREALRWQMGKLTAPGNEPFTSTDQWSPIQKGPDFPAPKERTGQMDMTSRMLHKDEKQRIPTILGGAPQEPLSAQSMGQRFNLVNPQDLGNYGSKQYDPMTDPSYQALLKLLGRHGPSTSNDR